MSISVQEFQSFSINLVGSNNLRSDRFDSGGDRFAAEVIDLVNDAVWDTGLLCGVPT